jgi:hypothetical protein
MVQNYLQNTALMSNTDPRTKHRVINCCTSFNTLATTTAWNNVMHFSFTLLRIKDLYMFRALLAHLQGVLHTATWYIACTLSVGCYQGWSGPFHSNPGSSQQTIHASNIPSADCVSAPEYEQVMLETWRVPWFSINWITSSSRWFHYIDLLGRTVS